MEQIKKNLELVSLLFLFIASLIAFSLGFSATTLIIVMLTSIPVLIYVYRHQGTPANFFRSFLILISFLPYSIVWFALFYTDNGLLYGEDTIKDFGSSLYFSLVTWTTLGYGDFQPLPNIRLWAATQAMFGYTFMAIFIALLFDGIVQTREYLRVKPIRLKAIELTYDACGVMQCGIFNAIRTAKNHQPNKDFFEKKFQDNIKQLDQFASLNGVALGIDLLIQLSELRPVLELLNKKMNLFYQLQGNKTSIVIKSPVNEINEIENVLKKIQNTHPGIFKDNRVLSAYGIDVTIIEWDIFKKEKQLFEPEAYISKTKEVVAFDIDTAKEIVDVKVGQSIRTLYG
jgi:hypothetical protein